jgi:nucleolar protein 53
VAAVAQGKLPRKMHARQRLTRAEVIVNAAHAVPPASLPAIFKRKGSGAPRAAAAALQEHRTRSAGGKRPAAAPALSDLWADEDGGGEAPKRPRHRPAPPRMPAAPAVAVDGPGCSYNPDREAHQEAVAVAVAAELKKATARELQPTAPVQRVEYEPEADELAALQTEAEMEGDGAGGSGSEEEGGGRGAGRAGAARPKTQQDRNRRQRRRAAEEVEEARRRAKRQRRQLSELPAIEADVAATLEAREARAERRRADAADRAAAAPPRLGRHLYEPLPLQVLATREIEAGGGSLRRLKPTPVLARERFKSLQRRGMIEPRRRVVRKKGRKVEFIHGQRADAAAERQEEVREARQAGQKAAAAARAGAKKKTRAVSAAGW